MGQPIVPDSHTANDRGVIRAVLEIPPLIGIAVAGFVLEFLYELPFMVICLLHEGAKGKNRSGKTRPR
jgi:hypothetical protein